MRIFHRADPPPSVRAGQFDDSRGQQVADRHDRDMVEKRTGRAGDADEAPARRQRLELGQIADHGEAGPAVQNGIVAFVTAMGVYFIPNESA